MRFIQIGRFIILFSRNLVRPRTIFSTSIYWDVDGDDDDDGSSDDECFTNEKKTQKMKQK